MPTVQVVRAVIIDNNDPERLGRVRVRYPWKGDESGGMQPSEWRPIRTRAHYQGAGDWHLPDFGDEVLVCFENGDSTKPIILGSLTPKHQSPPSCGRAGDHNKDKKNTLRFIKTNRHHLSVFDDTEGDRAIQLMDGEGYEFLISTDKHMITFRDRIGNLFEMLRDKKIVTLKSSQGHSIKLTEKTIEIIDAKGQLIIIGDNKILIQSKHGQILQLDEKGSVLKSPKSLTMQGKSKVTVAGKTRLVLGKGQSNAILKGKTFLEAFNSHVHPGSDKPLVPLPASSLSKSVKSS